MMGDFSIRSSSVPSGRRRKDRNRLEEFGFASAAHPNYKSSANGHSRNWNKQVSAPTPQYNNRQQQKYAYNDGSYEYRSSTSLVEQSGYFSASAFHPGWYDATPNTWQNIPNELRLRDMHNPLRVVQSKPQNHSQFDCKTAKFKDREVSEWQVQHRGRKNKQHNGPNNITANAEQKASNGSLTTQIPNQEEKQNMNKSDATNNSHSSEKECKPKTLREQLEELMSKSSNEILLTLCLKSTGFMQLLETVGDKFHLVSLMLTAIGRACSSSHRSNTMFFISAVTRSRNFMFYSIPQYLAHLRNFQSSDGQKDSLLKAVEFFDYYQMSFTASAVEVLPVILPLFKSTCEKIFTDAPDTLERIQKKIKSIEEQQDCFMQGHSHQEIKKASKTEKISSQLPPEEFREIPVLPNQTDIWEPKPFLRPNIVDGKYVDVEHYLDVQFRLLREDFVRPLREGIMTYLRLKNQGKPVSKNKEIRIYQNVHVVKQDFLHGSILHIAHFNQNDFKHVNWEHSKRFITGSLLCLSHDDYETMYFACVAFRDCKKLEEGILVLRFEGISTNVLNISPEQDLTMIETSAYFEAYRHNLAALHTMGTDNILLKKYVVSIENDVDKPLYLERSTVYNMGSLMCRNTVLDDEISDGDLSKREKLVSVLDTEIWPSYDDLGLDESQYKALKMAITKQFAIIQGPPGTGKTYVGLKIVQLLLQNARIWQGDEHSSPILIVCYTNHALDQFLDGIKKFTQNIVRIGGRCTSESLANYELRNIKRDVRQKRAVPSHIFRSVKTTECTLSCLSTDLGEIKRAIQESCDTIVSLETLSEFMTPEQQQYLGTLEVSPFRNTRRYGCAISNWLSVRKLVHHTAYFKNEQRPLMNAPPLMQYVDDEGHNESEEEEEFDVDFVEEMRDVDTEDCFGFTAQHNAYLNMYDYVEHRVEKQPEAPERAMERECIKIQLLNAEPMPEHEAENVINIWKLNSDKRWRLYKYWVQKYVEAKETECLQLQLQIKEEFEKLNEMRTEEDFHLLSSAKIVGMTTTGAAKYRNLVQNIQPRILVVEEAAEVLEAHIVTSLAQNTNHLILIGDHQQLKPSPTVYELATRFNLDISLFERMIKNGMDYCQLLLQHRMRPSIAELLVPHIYPNLLNHYSVYNYEDIRGVCKSMYFISHEIQEQNELDSKSRVNKHEAKFIVELCRYILLQGYESSQITILTAYSGQLFAIKKLAAKCPLLKGVRITIVDNYQGEENDIVLVSFVRSNSDRKIGFLKISNRVCVALSRARKGLYCIGNFNFLSKNGDIWKSILETLEQQEAIGPMLKLQCPNHKDVFTEVSSAEDFEKVPEGGCTQPCDYRLQCGHTCAKVCHSYDSEHTKMKCTKPCERMCLEQCHKCPKMCYEKCGPCKELVEKVIPVCAHKALFECHIEPEHYMCPEPCSKILTCGHKCKKQCGETCCRKECRVKIPIILLCGHEMKMSCSDSSSAEKFLSKCKEACQTELQCGHICTGTCGKCSQGRLHEACKETCNRILVCGHVCKSRCSKICPPCNRKCENRCKHSKCPKKCGEPCDPCMERCAWKCEHVQCPDLCGEKCSREPCDVPCPKLLKCKHKCVGMCGEPCPKCAICNEEEVRDIFFGTEDEPDAKFVRLEDCGHIVEIEGLTQWMQKANSNEIMLKCCPRCNTVIRRNLRFGNVIKSCLLDVEKVKQLAYGSVEENREKRKNLLSKLNSMKLMSHNSSVLAPVLNYLKKETKLSKPELIKYENIIMIGEEYFKIQKDVIYNFRFSCLSQTSPVYKNLDEFVKQTEKLISNFIQYNHLNASEYQLEELSWELLRLRHQRQLLELMFDCRYKLKENAVPHFAQATKCLCKLGPFRQEEVHTFNSVFPKLREACGGVVLNITASEKKMILEAMDLSKGHWYKCPKGHVYCITECGGAVLESRCNECGEKIGGGQHRLRSDNSLATEMDGAQHSAWSELENLRNYVP